MFVPFLVVGMPQTSNLPQMLREMEVFERSRPGANTGDMKQLSRITLYVDDIAETQVLVRGKLHVMEFTRRER